MKLVELPGTLAERVGCLIRPILEPSRAADDRGEAASRDLQSRWHIVSAQLAGWKSNPDQVADEGVRWRLPGRTWSIELDVDGSIESSLMAGTRLLWRHSIEGPFSSRSAGD